jgi:LuxR family maltose regulon positive regulatory protein
VAYALEHQGQLHRAAELLRDSFELADQDGRAAPVAGYIHVDLARLLYELNDLDAASRHLQEGIELCRRLADGRAQKIGHSLRVRVQLAQGETAAALESIREAAAHDPSPGTRFDLRGGEYPEVRLWLKQHRLQELGAWLQESGVDLDQVPLLKAKLNCTMQARALVALGRERPGGAQLADALKLLGELLRIAEGHGWKTKEIEILGLQSLALAATGDAAQAMAALERALALAEPEGFVRTFVDEGPPMARLLYEAVTRGLMPTYAGKLLAAFPETEAARATQATTPRVVPSEPKLGERLAEPLIEPLSEREQEVLGLLAEGLTNREIASRLFLSLNTIKAHTRNIYGKLDVHSRTQAVARARALGVLTSS